VVKRSAGSVARMISVAMPRRIVMVNGSPVAEYALHRPLRLKYKQQRGKMTTYLTAQFTAAELNWLQIMLQQLNEEVWANMGDSDHPQGGQNEHAWFRDFLNKVRACIGHPTGTVTFTDDGQLNFIKKLLTDYKNSTAGGYIFTGTWGDNVRIGQFPTGTGSANQNFTAQGGFPEEQFLTGSNIFNNILRKLGDVIYPPVSNIYHDAGAT
jgi:hypothetical protein